MIFFCVNWIIQPTTEIISLAGEQKTSSLNIFFFIIIVVLIHQNVVCYILVRADNIGDLFIILEFFKNCLWGFQALLLIEKKTSFVIPKKDLEVLRIINKRKR